MSTLAPSTGAYPGLAGPVETAAWCSGPARDRVDVCDLVTTDRNRWSREGEPTLYLAGDLGVALAEIGRHWQPNADGLGIWAVVLRLSTALDLRAHKTRSAFGIPRDPRWFLDRERCVDLATRARRGGCDGLIVPTVAFLDDVARWNAVVFVDRVAPLRDAVGDARLVHVLRPV